MWHQMASGLTGAWTRATGMSNVHATTQGHPIKVRQTCVPRWQDQAHMSEKLNHGDTMELRRRPGRRHVSMKTGTQKCCDEDSDAEVLRRCD